MEKHTRNCLAMEGTNSIIENLRRKAQLHYHNTYSMADQRAIATSNSNISKSNRAVSNGLAGGSSHSCDSSTGHSGLGCPNPSITSSTREGGEVTTNGDNNTSLGECAHRFWFDCMNVLNFEGKSETFRKLTKKIPSF